MWMSRVGTERSSSSWQSRTFFVSHTIVRVDVQVLVQAGRPHRQLVTNRERGTEKPVCGFWPESEGCSSACEIIDNRPHFLTTLPW